MRELWRVLGYDTVALRVAENFASDAGIQVLSGPPGVGKSWLAEGIGLSWEEQGGITLKAEGDPGRTDSSYYPFRTLSSLAHRWTGLGSVAVDAVQAGESVAGTKGLIASTIRVLAVARRARRNRRIAYLGEAEQNILHDLERLGRKKPLLLIADNLHWWDEDSLDCLRRLQSSELRADYPVLAAMRVLAVETIESYQAIANPRAREDLLIAGHATHHSLKRIPRESFDAVLRTLGAPSTLDHEQADLIFTLTGGHLVLAHRAASWTASRGMEALKSATADPERFRATLLTQRIHTLGALGPDALALLQIAANLGHGFRRTEILCANPDAPTETARLLRICRDENVLEVSDETCRFVHDLLRQFFLTAGPEDEASIHERLIACFRALRTSDYESRARSARRAGHNADAGALGVVALLQRDRDGHSWQVSAPVDIVFAVTDAGLLTVAESMSAARSALNQYRFSDCLAELDRLPRELAPILAAESDYLRAMCLMSTRSENDRAEGRARLEQWRDLASEEPELGFRLMRLLLYGLTHLEDKTAARELEGRIRRGLIDRIAVDARAADDLYSLDRSSGSLYEPDVALPRVREAARHFGPQPDEESVRHPLEYYRSLVNLGAIQICNARYEDSIETSSLMMTLLDGFEAGVFPRTDYAYANALLAEYRAGYTAPAAAAARQRAILSASPSDDPFYAANSLAAYLALDGAFDEAISIYDDLEVRLRRTRREPEASMTYLVYANRCVTKFLAGDREGVVQEWDRLTSVVARIAYATKPFLVRRHELLATVMAENSSLSPQEFDEYLPTRFADEFGPMWDNYGRGFRMPEVEFWREN